MSESVIAKGAPTPLLMSAHRWSWKHVTGPHAIVVPSEGDIPVGPAASSTVKSVEFNLADDITVHVDFGIVIKMLFSNSLYPELKENQMFSISNLLIDRDGGTITVVGNVLEKVAV